MTKEQLSAIKRRSAENVMVGVPGGLHYEARLRTAIEAWANEEWWRGFYAGAKAAENSTSIVACL